MVNEFDKPIKGELPIESIPYKMVLCRQVIKSNDMGDKLSIPKNLNLRKKYVYIIIPTKVEESKKE